MCNQADHSDVDCTEKSMRTAGIVSERDRLFACRDTHADKEACDHHLDGELHHLHEKVESSEQDIKEVTRPLCLDTTHAGKEAYDHHVSGKLHHLQEKVESCGQEGNDVTPCCCPDTTNADKEVCDHHASGKLHHFHEKVECSRQDSNTGTTQCYPDTPHVGKEACDNQVSCKLDHLHETVESFVDSNEVTPPYCPDTMVLLSEGSQSAPNGAVEPYACDIVSQSILDLSLAITKLDGMPIEAKTGGGDSLGTKEEQIEDITLSPEMSLNEKYYDMPMLLASRSQEKGIESIHSRSGSDDGFDGQVLVEGIEVLDSTVISTVEDLTAKELQEAVIDSFQTADNKAEEGVSSVGCFEDNSEELFLETGPVIIQVDPHNPSNSLENSQQDVGVEKVAVSTEELSGVIQQESPDLHQIDEAANSSSMSKGTTGMDLAGFFSNAKGSKYKTENEDQDHTSSPIKPPPKNKAFMESPRSLRVLLFSDGKIPTTSNKDEKLIKDAKGLEFSSRVAPAAQSNVHEGHIEYGFFDKGCDNKDNTEFMSIAFSGALTYQGLVAYSGPMSYSGSISHRSDSSASTRSFAFPILAPDWNSSSPVKMAAPDPRFFQQRRKWHFCVCCRRPSTLFD